MAGKHTGPRTSWGALIERQEWADAHMGILRPLTGKHHKTCAPAIVKAQYNRWLNSTERTHTRKEELSG